MKLPRFKYSGLIPAHAGKTSRTKRGARPRRAHPRSRGENGAQKRDGDRPRGSSPLTRGKREITAQEFNQARLIPAHAGKTRGVSVVPQASGAHPRSRGENEYGRKKSRITDGSSPLTRGKHDDGIAPRPRVGLIPAHAGKTRCARRTLG